jgi:predicted Fe-Mo cluster-binding NifX family protein
MKIAISVATAELDAALDPRFGRAAAFAIVDTASGDQQVVANPAVGAAGGAGIQAAEFVVKQGVEAVISGSFGPNASDVLAAANVKMYHAASGSASDLARKLKDGTLDQATGTTGGGGGVGGGRGSGRGRGGGRGRGRKGGRGQGRRGGGGRGSGWDGGQ